VNIELLRRVQAHILAEPKRMYMFAWLIGPSQFDDEGHYNNGQNGDTLNAPACKTVACIRGWAYQLTNTSLPLGEYYCYYSSSDPILELTREQCDRLFFVTCWSAEFQDRLDATQLQSQEYAQVVSDRIDRFIETEGRE
jgi:hypothetical protein